MLPARFRHPTELVYLTQVMIKSNDLWTCGPRCATMQAPRNWIRCRATAHHHLEIIWAWYSRVLMGLSSAHFHMAEILPLPLGARDCLSERAQVEGQVRSEVLQ